MALISIGSAGNMVNQAASALGSNAITNALGIDFGTILTPSKFLTKFSPSTVFAYRSLAYEIRTALNFDVIFHWFPRCSQIRTMLSNAFSAVDTTEINLLVQDVKMPSMQNLSQYGNSNNSHFRAAMTGSGVNGQSDLTISFLNTEFSYISHCFYQWISETESPFWIYGPGVLMNPKKNGNNNDNANGKSDSKGNTSLELLKSIGSSIRGNGNDDHNQVIQSIEAGDMSKMLYLRSESEIAPFTRADIEIKYYSANMKELHSVWFMGAFPTSITMESLDNKNEPDDAHSVSFTYDSMCISSPFKFGKSSSITSGVASALASSGLSNTSEWTAGLYDDTLTQIGNTYLAKLSRKMNKITNKTGDKLSSKLQKIEKKFTA